MKRAAYSRGGIKGVFGALAYFKHGAVLVAPIDAVTEHLVGDFCNTGGGLRLSFKAGKVAVVVHKSVLKSLYIYRVGGCAAPYHLGCCGSYCLTHKGAGCHNSYGRKRNVSDAYVSACEEQILYILGVKRAERNAPR